jgi:hypothetical protein
MNWQSKTKEDGGVQAVNIPERIKPAKLKKFSKGKSLECRLCYSRYSLADIMNGTYNLETYICSYCYADMQRKPHPQSCFGKPTFILLDGTRLPGYDPEARDCNRLCPDRELCKRIVLIEETV